LKQDLIQDGDLSIAKTDGLLTALDSTAKLALANTFTGLQTINGDLKADHVLVKITAPTLNTHLTSKLYVDTAISNVNVDTTNLSKLDQANTFTATNTFTDITTTSLINNNKNIDDRNHFHYTNTGSVFNRGNGQTLVWATVIRGSSIFEGASFKPKYTGLYTISIAVFCGNTTLGDESLRLGLQLNNSNYNLNGGATYIVSCDASLNKDVNILHGTMVVDAVANQPIRVVVRSGSCRYVGSLSYFYGYYVGAS
jgi:hypothetical protein